MPIFKPGQAIDFGGECGATEYGVPENGGMASFCGVVAVGNR